MTVPARINRRALLGWGALGASIVGTVGAVALLDTDPPSQRRRARGARRAGRLDGLVSAPIAALLSDPEVLAALDRRGIRLDDIESLTLAEAAEDEVADGDFVISALPAVGVDDALGRSALFTSPLVLQARPGVAESLAAAGLLQPDSARTFVDAARLLASDAPFAVADPRRSDAAWLFAGLAAALLGGVEPAAAALRARLADDDMDAFMAVDPAAAPMRVGFEADLYAWIAADPNRWAQLQAAAPDAAPVTLHLRPTLYATWTLIARDTDAQPLAAALLTPELQSLGRLRHGLRGPQRQSAAGETFQSAARLPPPPTDVATLPDLGAMRTLVERLAD